MLTYPGDPRGYPTQNVALSSLSTSAAPFTVDGPHSADPTFPNPSLDVPAAAAAVPYLNAAGGWGNVSRMEAPARYMAPDAAAAASLGYTGEVFDSAPYGIYSGNHFRNFVDLHPFRAESSELISEKGPGTCRENSQALSNGFGLSAHCQQQNAFTSKLVDHIGAENVGSYFPRQLPNQDPPGSAISPIGGVSAGPNKNLTSGSVVGNISSQTEEAEINAHTQVLAKEGQEHSHCHSDAEEDMLQMSDSSSGNQAIFLELMHNLAVGLISTCDGGSSLHEYEKEKLKSVIQNLEVVSSIRGKAMLRGDDYMRKSSQMSNNFSVAIPEHSVSKNTDSEFSTSTSQALPKLPEDKMLDDSEVSQVSIYKRLWIEAEALVCKLKYELQLARMKLATMKVHTNTETVPIAPSEGDKASRLPVPDGKPDNHAKESSTCAATWQCHRGDSYGSQFPVVNRARTQQSSCVPAASLVPPPPALVPQPYPVASDILSGPHCDNCHKLGPTLQQCYKKSESKCEEHQKESEGSYAVEDAVLMRLRILKSRADNKTSLGLESSNQQRHASTNTSGEIDDACANMCTRLEVLNPCIENLSSLDDNKCEEQQKESKGSYSVGDAVSARLQILKSCADNTISFDLESSKQQQLNASTDIAPEIDNVMAIRRILKSRPDGEASSSGDAEGVEEDPCVVGLQVSSCQSPPLPAAVLEKTTSPSATEPPEVTAETSDFILPSTASMDVPPLSTLKDAPSVTEKDHSGLADDAAPPAPLLSVPQEVAKVKGLPHVPISRCFRLPSAIRIKRPISEQGARAILLRKLGMIKGDEVDEQAMDRCMEVLEASFPKCLLQAVFCGSDMVKGTPGELWGISASDVVF